MLVDDWFVGQRSWLRKGELYEHDIRSQTCVKFKQKRAFRINKTIFHVKLNHLCVTSAKAKYQIIGIKSVGCTRE